MVDYIIGTKYDIKWNKPLQVTVNASTEQT